MNQKSGYFISIGGGENQLPLIEKALSKGFSVITVDKNNLAPGFSKSKIKIIESTSEYRKVLNALSHVPLTETIIGVGCRSFANACYTASYIANKLNLPGPSSEVVRFLLNKKDYLLNFSKLGIPVPQSFTLNKESTHFQLPKNIEFPLIAKPIFGNSKTGLYKITNEDDLNKFLENFKNHLDEFIFQRYIPGQEVVVLGFVGDKEFSLVSCSDKWKTSYLPYFDRVHILPTSKENYIGEIDRIMNYLSKYLKLTFTPLLAEFLIDDRDNLYLLELAPEVGGEFLADYLIPEYYKIDYFDMLFDLLTEKKLPNPIYYKVDNKESAIFYLVPEKNSQKVKEPNSFETSKNEKIFFQKKLLEENSVVNFKKGNLNRSYCIGITRELNNFTEPRELWIESVFNRLGTGYLG